MNLLGWMRAPEESLARWDEYVALAAAVRADGLTRILVCGMGGSSLVADVLAETFGARSLHVLDSTNPAAVRAAGDPRDLARTLFVISSKSGNTVETLAFCHYFAARARPEQFIAITEVGTPLHALARPVVEGEDLPKAAPTKVAGEGEQGGAIREIAVNQYDRPLCGLSRRRASWRPEAERKEYSRRHERQRFSSDESPGGLLRCREVFDHR